MLFRKKDLLKIEKSIKEAELKTSGEIVPIIVNQSRSYIITYFICGHIGFIASLIYIYFISKGWGFNYTIQEILLIQILIVISFVMIGIIPFIRKLLIPKRIMEQNVRTACLSNFIASGLLETRDRTGILIFISLFERKVTILADKGINDNTPPDYWQIQVDSIIKGIKKKKPTDALCNAINEMGNKLAEHFPPRPDDTNELSNEVRIGHQDKNKEEKK